MAGRFTKRPTEKNCPCNFNPLVENPVVSAWVDNSLKVMKDKASRVPISQKLTPNIKEGSTGKGYPVPKPV